MSCLTSPYVSQLNASWSNPPEHPDKFPFSSHVRTSSTLELSLVYVYEFKVWRQVEICPRSHVSQRETNANAIMAKVNHVVSNTFVTKVMGMKLGLWRWWNDSDWEYPRTRYWGKDLGIRGTRWQGSGEDYVTGSFMVWTHQTSFGWSDQEERDGRSTWRVEDQERCIQGFGGKSWEKETTLTT